MKLCSKCGKEGKFYKDATKKDGLHPVCQECHRKTRKERHIRNPDSLLRERAKSKEWREANPEKSRLAITNATLKAKYGIDLETYDQMLKDQKGGCKVCGDKPSYQRLHVDHCHNTGRVRGLLCQACNVSIGKMKESPELLRALATYIEEN